MKLKLFVKWLTGSGLAVALGVTATICQPSHAESNRFFCDKSQDDTGRTVPTTFGYTPTQGNVRMILWVRNDFEGSRYTPEYRCEEVATRFQRHYENRTLKFIRTGTVNNLPVLCIASSKGGSCPNNQVIVTLKQGTDPKPILDQLLDMRRRSAGRPLYLSGNGVVFYDQGETYIDIEKLLELPPVDGNSLPPSKTQPGSQPAEPLWEMEK